jgi:DNA polymerase-1
MCFRTYFGGNRDLSHKGRSVNLLYGFFRQLIALDKKYPDYYRVIAWDGGYERRLRESEEGVKQGLCPDVYKGQRERDNPELDDLFAQRDELRSLLHAVRCTQVRTEGFEADDLINTYAKANAARGGHSVIISTDQDFFQCLAEGIEIYDAMKKELWTEKRFSMEFGFHPSLWVDAGAIMGEVGPSKDNIYGVDGWGPKTSCDYVCQFGNIDSIIEGIRAKKKRGKREEKFLEQIPRLRLAYSLKQMDIVSHPPKLRTKRKLSEKELKGHFLELGFASLLKDVKRLV